MAPKQLPAAAPIGAVWVGVLIACVLSCRSDDDYRTAVPLPVREWFRQYEIAVFQNDTEGQRVDDVLSMLDEWEQGLLATAPASVALTRAKNMRLQILAEAEAVQRKLVQIKSKESQKAVLSLARHALATFPWTENVERIDMVGTAIVVGQAAAVDPESVERFLTSRMALADGEDAVVRGALTGMLAGVRNAPANPSPKTDAEVAHELCRRTVEKCVRRIRGTVNSPRGIEGANREGESGESRDR